MRIFLFALALFLTACDDPPEAPPEQQEEQIVEAEKQPPARVLTQVSFEDLPAWGDDQLETFVQAFSRSCNRFAKKAADTRFGLIDEAGTYGDWQKICMDFALVETPDLQEFIEGHFTPYMITADAEPIGLFTGYYEASLRGSLQRSPKYNVPLHKRPDDLVMVQLGDFREDLKGVRIAGRVKGGNLKPYETREEIVTGKWPHNNEVLLWVDNAVDAFFVQIQGSGLVQMDDGSTMRIGYAGQNGHIYYAIGRELIKRGHLTKENVSMQSIRQWLDENADQADEIMNTNASYVFFHEIHGEGPIGGEGIALTAGRSLAVDRSLIPYGLPMWVDIEAPVEGANPIQRLMIAQDTGGAITGPVRGDVFWGYGDIAADMAGKMAAKGRYWAFLPKVSQ